MTKYVNACKIPNFLLYCQFLNLKLGLDYNTTNLLGLPSNTYKEDISLRESNNNKKRIRLANINNNGKDIRLINIDEQKPAILN